MNIVVGSTSNIKVEAVKEACAKLGISASVSGVDAPSLQNAQPVDFEEIYDGACNRAEFAQHKMPNCVAIGIESGIFTFSHVTLDIALIVVLHNGKKVITTSSGLRFPSVCVEVAEERGFESTTVGDIISKSHGGVSFDPHSTLTGGKVTRKDTLVVALEIALKQI